MKKETINIVIVGHVDHGKSTLIGRLLFETKSLSQEKIVEVEKISKQLGKEAKLAYLTDQLEEERKQGITIDTTQIFFKTKKRNFVIIDAPGHVEFLKNMISGASFAQAAVLIVDTKEGLMKQTKRHAYLLHFLGIDKVIVVLNKMDLVDYQKLKFEKVKREVLKFLEGLQIEPCFVIPVSAKESDNIVKRSSKMNWYQGPDLLKALHSFKLNSKRIKNPLRFPIQDIYKISGKKMIVGKIVSGSITRGQKITLLPCSKQTTVNSIKVFKRQKTKALENENIGLTLEPHLPVKRGDIIVQDKNPPKLTNCFQGTIFWLFEKPLKINKKITLRCSTQEVECWAEKIEKRINSSTLKVIEKNPKKLAKNETGSAILKTTRPIVVEKFNFIEELGRFTIEEDHDIQGLGIIKKPIYE